MLENILKDIKHLPFLFVFDLDYTLWPFWCDTHVMPPVRVSKQNELVDRNDFKITLYDNVIEILTFIKDLNIPIGFASRTHAPDVAEILLAKLKLNQYVTYKEIYPGSKIKHFDSFTKESNIPYSKMIFFDDENRNIKEISELGVTCHLVENGLSVGDLKEALQLFNCNLQ